MTTNKVVTRLSQKSCLFAMNYKLKKINRNNLVPTFSGVVGCRNSGKFLKKFFEKYKNQYF